MTTLTTGSAAPDFTLPVDDGGTLSLSSLKGQRVIVYFYPKDDTPGCTKEACGFNEALQSFKTLNARVIGISKDSVSRHEKFKAKYGLNFTLASDGDGQVCEAYGTWIEKSLYGRKYMGIDRATFLIDEDGIIAALWRGVKVSGHVEAVSAALERLK
jgi:thioredoxin-dependent peroxiredoxin